MSMSQGPDRTVASRIAQTPNSPEGRSGRAHFPVGAVAGLIVCLLAVAGADPAHAQVYRWTDDRGRVHYLSLIHISEPTRPC